MGKIKAILKIVSASFALVGGTVSEAVGIPLICVGVGHINDAEDIHSQAIADRNEAYAQSDEYQLLKEEEENRIANLKVRFEKAEEDYNNALITYDEYYSWKSSYENEVKYYNNDFFKQCFKNSENKPQLYIDPYYYDLNSKGYTERNIGIVLTVLGGAYLLFKGGWYLNYCDGGAYETSGMKFSRIIRESASELIKGSKEEDDNDEAEEDYSDTEIDDEEQSISASDEKQENKQESLLDTSEEYYRY